MKAQEILEQQVAAWEAQRDIKNLMGRYANCIILNRYDEIWPLFWAGTQTGACLGVNEGWYLGREAVRGYYHALTQHAKQVAEKLAQRFPGRLGETEEERYGVGVFRVEPLACPVIEIAEDGATARGLWYCQGATADTGPAGPTAHWTWGYCAADFVREGDEWRIWHLQRTNDIDARCGSDWARQATPLPPLPAFEGLPQAYLPAPTRPARLRGLYTPGRQLEPPPPLPRPYTTFAAEHSYGWKEAAHA